ncbi:MAG: alpha/beta hydrolase [Treponema sp.]|nr:alpha/beta hydrolase [Treponema sp.]
MKKIFVAGLSVVFAFSSLFAQEKIYLWPEKTAPGSKNVNVQNEIIERSKVEGVNDRAEMGITQPYMTLYKAKNPNGVAVLIAPGGAYQRVVFDVEGADRAKLYCENGYTVFVLNYRLPGDGHAEGAYAPLADAQRAIRIIRSKASEYGVNPEKIGVMGSSAGGHLASCLGTMYEEKIGSKIDEIDDVYARPDFMMLCYPVITMQDAGTHAGSRKVLLGEKPKKKMQLAFSTDLLVTDKTPQTFIALSQNDGSVKLYYNGVAFAHKLSEKGVPYELHIFQDGKHGFKTNDPNATCKDWQQISLKWLNDYVNK